MKYFVFAVAALGVPPLAFLLYINKRWQKYSFLAMVVGLVLYNGTSINFFSMEDYRGTARGMEVSVVHLFALALLISLKLQGKLKKLVPETGFGLYIVYFLLCLPSLSNACNLMVSWFEIWKMILLYVFYLTVYTYLKATDDLVSVLRGLSFYAIVNMAFVMKDRLTGIYQAHGVFPHQNSMAMAMQLLGALFFSGFLIHGLRSRMGKMSFAAFCCAAVATLRSYSRGAIALMPIAYGIVTLYSLGQTVKMRVLVRLAPIALAGLVGIALLLPKIIERFVEAPEASGNTRVELAYCAAEMIRDQPVMGVGINNWALKMLEPYTYQEDAGAKLDKELEYTGIVETVYLLVAAECGIPALVAMLLWFGWHWLSCLKLVKRLKGTYWGFVPVGLLGGLTAVYMQCCLEWVLRQQVNLFLLVFLFAMVAYLNRSWQSLRERESAPKRTA